jgi:hypothetical protein
MIYRNREPGIEFQSIYFQMSSSFVLFLFLLVQKKKQKKDRKEGNSPFLASYFN